MRWSIGRRLAVLGIVMVGLSFVVGGIGFTMTGRLADQSAEAVAVANLRATVIDAQHTVAVVYADAHVLKGADAETREAALTEMDEHAAEMRESVETLKQARVGADIDAQMATAFLPAVGSVLDQVDAVDATKGAVSTAQIAAFDAAWGTFDEVSDKLGTAFDELVDSEEATTATRASQTRTSILIVGLIVILAAAGMTALSWRAIAPPVHRTRELLDRVAAGDFTQRLEVRGRDDLSDMATALNSTLDQMDAALRTISAEADSLHGASTQLTDVSRRMAGSAQRVRTEAGSASQEVGNVDENVQAVAASTEQVHASVTDIARNAADGAGIVNEAVDFARSANGTISKLGDSSNQIGEVAKVITSIAEQTNLLALNATIEAARAGESGKGFAVVAGEVKELAQQTALATENIGSRIAAIQSDSAATAEALEQIGGTIGRIAEIQTMIATAVEQQTAATGEIGHHATRAAAGTGGITTRIGVVAESAADTSAAAGETERAAADLATTSVKLRTIVQKFRLTA